MLKEEIKPQARTRIDSLQVLRALAFLGIFISHSRMNSQLGAWGVSVFFVLSGFLMMYSYQDRELSTRLPDALKFSLRKIRKLYPLHILMMIVAIPYEYHRSGFALTAGYLKMLALKIVSTVTLTQAWVPSYEVFGSFNGISWYLSASMFLYFCFPYIRKFIAGRDRYRPWLWMGAVYALMALATFSLRNAYIMTDYPDNCYWTAYTCPLLRLGDFIIGCNVGYIYLHRPADKHTNERLVSAASILVVLLVALSAFLYATQRTFLGHLWCRYTVLWVPTSAALVYLFALNEGVVAVLGNNRTLKKLGDMSPYAFLINEMFVLYTMILADKYLMPTFVPAVSGLYTSVLAALHLDGLPFFVALTQLVGLGVYLIILAVFCFVLAIIATRFYLKKTGAA